jgi:hypothetical protein
MKPESGISAEACRINPEVEREGRRVRKKLVKPHATVGGDEDTLDERLGYPRRHVDTFFGAEDTAPASWRREVHSTGPWTVRFAVLRAAASNGHPKLLSVDVSIETKKSHR